MNMRVLFANALTIAFCLSGSLYSYAGDDSREAAWTAWKKGNVAEAATLASDVKDAAERNDLLFRCALVGGKYELALEHYSRIAASYHRHHELRQPVIDCYLHLARYGDAFEFAQKLKVGPIDSLKMQADRPIQAFLNKVTIVPFADHELSPYFPAFQAELEGKSITVHVDTGASFITMHPNDAKKFGIQLIEYGRGNHGHRTVKLSFGIAAEFKLGDAILKNVPVIVFPTNEHIIFGTKVLSQFVSTLDYPRKRLILSPRGSAEHRRDHMALLPQNRAELPFYMWGDHYMFARGFVGDDKQVTFFMDSGLVALRKINDDPTIQAGFTSSLERYRKWGYRKPQIDQRFFRSHLPIGLGTLSQDGIWYLTGPTGEHHGKNIFGGVEMHGCLGHAFVKSYAWTLDFETHKYIFSADEESL